MRKLAPLLIASSLITSAGLAFAEPADEEEEAEPSGVAEESVLPPEGEAFEESDPAADETGEEETDVAANTRTAKNSVYVELLGPGIIYSVNYDRVITDDFSARIGFSYLSLGTSASSGGTTTSAEAKYWAIPITAHYLGISSGNHALELGAGGSIMSLSGDVGVGDDNASGSVTTAALTGIVGYRRQAPQGGFNFRIGASPMYLLEGGYTTWGYMSFGATF